MPYRDHFELDPDLFYMNHAAVAPWPRRTREAVERFAAENALQGSLRYPQWVQTETTLRAHLQTLINAPSINDIALVKNTSEALSLVAYGLAWLEGDNIVSCNEEFPSNRIVWDGLAERGVALREVDLHSGPSPEETLIAACDGRTRLIAVSAVQYGSGLRLDLERLGEFCRHKGILFCVDAIQAVGAVQVDVQRANIDFLAADGHKWMLGPEGLGVFYCTEQAREALALTQYGWHMVEAVGDFDRREWEPAHSARRFEPGSPNMLTVHALEASLSLLLELGMAEVEQAVLANSRYLFDRLGGLIGYSLYTPREDGRHAGIVTVRTIRGEAADLHRYLNANRVFCAPRGGGVRFSPHFHTPREQLDRVIELLRMWDGAAHG